MGSSRGARDARCRCLQHHCLLISVALRGVPGIHDRSLRFGPPIPNEGSTHLPLALFILALGCHGYLKVANQRKKPIFFLFVPAVLCHARCDGFVVEGSVCCAEDFERWYRAEEVDQRREPPSVGNWSSVGSRRWPCSCGRLRRRAAHSAG